MVYESYKSYTFPNFINSHIYVIRRLSVSLVNCLSLIYTGNKI